MQPIRTLPAKTLDMTEAPPETNFFATGGTLPFHAPSYVERQADADILRSLLAGEFCYVLTSRQMGKSSLMVRAAARLRAKGVEIVVLDLSRIGNLLETEQWYYSLASQMAQRLGAQKELRSFWKETEAQSPLQKWIALLENLLLQRPDKQVVIFIDEIDQVRALNFSTDEFFAAIRACYNRRSEDPHFAQVSFCLLGVAAPSDLIRDTRLTPFNIGRRIELTDFTEQEADLLKVGLKREEFLAEALLTRVLYWTGGHPYLTQRLCQEVADTHLNLTPDGVDRLCEDLFLSPAARTHETNLLFVKDRLLMSETDVASVLDMYRHVIKGKLVSDVETDRRVSVLRLSGIVRSGKRFSARPQSNLCSCVRSGMDKRKYAGCGITSAKRSFQARCISNKCCLHRTLDATREPYLKCSAGEEQRENTKGARRTITAI